jgi:hypothetical protein
MPGFVVNGKRHTSGRNVVLGMEEEIPETAPQQIEMIEKQRRLIKDQRGIIVSLRKKLEEEDRTIVSLREELEEEEKEAQAQYEMWQDSEKALLRERDQQINRGFNATKKFQERITSKDAYIKELLAENADLRNQLFA